jgi:hypothetical protein
MFIEDSWSIGWRSLSVQGRFPTLSLEHQP